MLFWERERERFSRVCISWSIVKKERGCVVKMCWVSNRRVRWERVMHVTGWRVGKRKFRVDHDAKKNFVSVITVQFFFFLLLFEVVTGLNDLHPSLFYPSIHSFYSSKHLVQETIFEPVYTVFGFVLSPPPIHSSKDHHSSWISEKEEWELKFERKKREIAMMNIYYSLDTWTSRLWFPIPGSCPTVHDDDDINDTLFLTQNELGWRQIKRDSRNLNEHFWKSCSRDLF